MATAYLGFLCVCVRGAERERERKKEIEGGNQEMRKRVPLKELEKETWTATDYCYY